jgi:hypothetical protein
VSCADAVWGKDRRRRRARCRAIIFAEVAGEMTEEVKLVLGSSPASSASSTRLRRSWEPSLDLLRPPAAGCWDEGMPRRDGSMVAEASLCA